MNTNQKTITAVLAGVIFFVHTTSVAAPKPTASTIATFVSSLFAAAPSVCPAAYTQLPNVPMVEYQGLSRLRASQLISNVTASAIQQDQTLKTQPYLNLPLPDGSSLGTYNSPQQGVDLYRIHYRSTNVSGQDTLVSGLVALPQESMSGGIIVYDHATQVSQQSGAPSAPSGEACIIVTAMAGKDRIVAMPDYLGFGINNDIHPYPLGVMNVPAGQDMIIAARELAQQIHPSETVGTNLYVTGYSEGGGNALWLGRVLEQSAQTNMMPTLMAPMSGNYDMTGAMAHSLIVNQPTKPIGMNAAITLLAKPVLLTFTAQAAWEIVARVSPASLLQPSMVSYDQTNPLPVPYSGKAEIQAYVTGLSLTGYKLGYANSSVNPSVLMQPSLVSDIQTTNLSNPVIALWGRNDNLNWRPKVPIYATGILQDQIVPYAGSNYQPPASYTGGKPFFAQGNSQNLIKTMRANGLNANQVAWCGIDAETITTTAGKPQMINHLTGLVPVSILAARSIEAGTVAGMPALADPR